MWWHACQHVVNDAAQAPDVQFVHLHRNLLWSHSGNLLPRDLRWHALHQLLPRLRAAGALLCPPQFLKTTIPQDEPLAHVADLHLGRQRILVIAFVFVGRRDDDLRGAQPGVNYVLLVSHSERHDHLPRILGSIVLCKALACLDVPEEGRGVRLLIDQVDAGRVLECFYELAQMRVLQACEALKVRVNATGLLRWHTAPVEHAANILALRGLICHTEKGLAL
mmetsp:Transcript_72468/g.155199  ORF Transcript_72468/g.155199 Transcript_72468/m.155199 type:complete len:222 (-) Transcript_72468:69-734(-)